MDSETFLTLINNMALLLLLGLAYDLLYTPQIHYSQTLKSLTTGIVLSCIGIIIMLFPWRFTSGIVFDTRSILLCISGLFFGMIPTLLAAITTITLRIFQGGSGTLTGILVITASAAIGLLWQKMWKGKSNWYSFLSLYTLGWAVHIVMLLLMLTLPKMLVVPLLKQLSLPVLIIYPLGTAFLGSLLKMRMDQLNFARELQSSKERLRVTFRSIGDGVITTDLQGKVELLNISAEKLTGWTQKQAEGKALDEVFSIFDSETNKQAINPVKKVLESGAIVGLANHTKLISKNGKEYQIADSAAPIRNEQGMVNGVVLVFRDISQEYQMREELKASENLYRAIFHNTGTATCIWDADGEIQLANSKFAELTGHTLEEIQKKKTWMDFAAAEDLTKITEQHNLRRKDRKNALNEYEFTLIDKYQHKKIFASSLILFPEQTIVLHPCLI